MEKETRQKFAEILAKKFAENAIEFSAHGVTLNIYASTAEYLNAREGIFGICVYSRGRKLTFGHSKERIDERKTIYRDEDVETFEEWFEDVRAKVLSDYYFDDVKVAE